MAKRKVTVTLDEDVYKAIKNNTPNVSAAVNKLAVHYLALEKQRQAIAELDADLRAKGVTRDPEQARRMDAWAEALVRDIENADCHS